MICENDKSREMVVGVDLGGTFIKFGIFHISGELVEKWKVPTMSKNFAASKNFTTSKILTSSQDTMRNIDVEDVVKLIVNEIKEHIKALGVLTENLRGIGIGIPGAVDNQGVVINAPNLGWSMIEVRKIMEKYIQVPVYIGNDANVAALGEQYFGVGEGCDSMVLVTLGTGVGGGVVVNQRLVPGFFGGAGEIGHIAVNPDETVPCGCGKKGCLEQYASATGIANMARKKLVAAMVDEKEGLIVQGAEALDSKDMMFQDAVSALQQFSLESITAKEVFDAVKAGDELAMEVAEQFGEVLGRALSYVACVVDPQMFVIGGGVSAAGEVLISYIEKYYKKYAFTPSKNVKIKLATLGNDAGIYGAARLAMIGE